MSTMGPIASAVPPVSISHSPQPPASFTPTSQPNLGAPPPATPSVPPQASGSSPPRAVVLAPAPPLVTPPASNLSPPPPDEASLPRKPTSFPPPPPSSPRKVLAPTPSSSPPSPTTPSDPPNISTPPPSSPTIPPPSPPAIPPPSPPAIPPPSPPAPKPPTSSPPPQPSVSSPTSSPPPPLTASPTSTPPLPSLNPPPPKSVSHGSPPPPSKSPPITPPHTLPNSHPPPPETITSDKPPPSPISAPPPPLPYPPPTNSSTNSSSLLPIPVPPPPHSDISPPYSDYSPDTPAKANSTKNNGMNAAVAAGVGVSLGIIALSLIILMVWCIIKRKKETSLAGRYVMPSPYGSSPRTDSTLKINSSAPLIQSGSESVFDSRRDLEGPLGHSRLSFTHDELAEATDRFSPDNLLGEGGFGYVYKGKLPSPDGREIAVKQLKIGSGQGEREFQAEVEIISRIHHRHLVSLVGYCVADRRRLLVYEYVPNNTLYFHLHGEGRAPLDWATRVKVAAGAARGLAYLHEDCHPRVIHRDIKSSNILLTENFDARVSDFGLAKLACDGNTHVTTRVIGTFGYMAPEYASSGKLTEKSDVYSFGVVLLELITGRKPVDSSRPLGDESLVEWARPLLSHAIETAEFGALADPRLENKYINDEMFRMIEASAACVRHSATKRPTMGQLVRAFDSILPSDITNGMQMGQSEIYNTAEQSAEIRLFRKIAFGSQNYSYSTDYFSTDNSRVHGENNLLVKN